MNPVKLLASRNLLIAIAVLAVVFVAFVALQTQSGATETMPSAERFSAPPAPSGAAVPLDTILAAYKQSRTTALRKYRYSPFTTQVDAVTPVNKNGWASAVTAGGSRATLYFANDQWPSGSSALAAGQVGTFLCADWQSGPSGMLMMYGCGVVARQ
jgi:hypothetical protein